MPPKNSNNPERRTRNSSRGRSPGRGAPLSSSNSNTTGLQTSTSLSPPSNSPLPDEKVNKVTSPSNSAVKPPVGESKAPLEKSRDSSNVDLSHNYEKPATVDQMISVNTQTENATAGVGDNRLKDDTDPSRKASDDILRRVLSDLQEIKATMSSIHNIEETTASISKEVTGLSKRTTELEEIYGATAARVRELGDDITTLKNTVQEHERLIPPLKKTKEEIYSATNKKFDKVNERIDGQKEQIEELQSTVHNVKRDLSVELNSKIEKKFDQLAQEAQFQSLREQAFRNRFNLVIIGLAEDDQKSTADLVSTFFESTLKVKNIKLNSAIRMGPIPVDHHSYVRPILVKFDNINHRNRIWKKRQVITGENDEQQIRILADLPKDLREGVQLLYKVAKAASKFEQFKSAKVFNYQLELHNKIYQPSQLEDLPIEIRPSTLSTPRSEDALVFFSKRSMLSNHFPSEFTIGDEKYYTVEQYLCNKS